MGTLRTTQAEFVPLVRIEDLTPGTGLWRVDWLGAITFRDRSRSAYQPSIEVALSTIESVDDAAPSLFQVLSAKKPQKRRAWLRVGQLPLLKVGSVWENGYLVGEPDGCREEFFDLEVTRATTSLVKAGLALPTADNDHEAFLLPLSEHPEHMDHTHSYCVVVELSESRRLIVPCAELIRFYFGSSSTLLGRLFRAPLRPDMFYRDVRFDRRTRKAQLKLAGGISGVSAADVARIALSRTAWGAANQIGASLLAGHANNRPPYPQCSFPFKGRTDLAAIGRWLPFDGQNDKTFVVHCLLSCSHPFPFSSLQYKMDWQVARPGNVISGSSNSGSERRKVSRKSTPDNPALDQSDPSSRMARRTYHLGFVERFPDLRRKSILKTDLKSPSQGDVEFVDGIEPERFAVGDEGTAEGIAPLDLLNARPIKEADRKGPPEFLVPVVEALKQLSDVRVEVLTACGKDGWTLPVPIIADGDGEIDPRCFRAQESETHRPRRYGAFAISMMSDAEVRHWIALEAVTGCEAIVWQMWAGTMEQDSVEKCLLSVNGAVETESGDWQRVVSHLRRQYV